MALAVLWIAQLSLPALVIYLAVVLAVGHWAAGRAEQLLAAKDPGAIVIDEVAGMTISVLVLPPTPAVLLAGFVLFRVFDVVKPYPARVSQHLPGGLGVMIDDVIAGVYALGVLWVCRRLTGWP